MNKEQKDFHKSRRKEFAKMIGRDSAAIIFGSTLQNKSFDGDFPFKQYKNFYYLTGFKEPNAAILIAPGGLKIKLNEKELAVNDVLFVQKKDELMETWNGKRLGFDKVKSALGIENGAVNTDLKNLLTRNSLKDIRRLYINFAEALKLKGDLAKIILPFLNNLNIIATSVEIIDASYLMGKIRAVKTPFEINFIKRACEITSRSYKQTFEMIKQGLYEYQVQANLEYHYKFYNGENAYEPIVAGGENACILHYENNDKILKSGQLLLIDSGAEFEYYCSDVTRTIPVNGKFTKEQRTIYEIVLQSNKECIRSTKPGAKLSELRELSEKILAEGLFKAGILKNKKDIKTYSVHGLGHHIGLDTHDAVSYNNTPTDDNDILKAGNVLTIEPGLYFPENSKNISKNYHGIGVRIEDDVLVTKSGCENFTVSIVKEIKDIESAMKK